MERNYRVVTWSHPDKLHPEYLIVPEAPHASAVAMLLGVERRSAEENRALASLFVVAPKLYRALLVLYNSVSPEWFPIEVQAQVLEALAEARGEGRG